MALVGTPHHLFAQGMEILGTCTFNDLHAVRRPGQGEACGVRQLLAAAVKRHEEVVGAALDSQFDQGVLANDDRSHV